MIDRSKIILPSKLTIISILEIVITLFTIYKKENLNYLMLPNLNNGKKITYIYNINYNKIIN